MGFRQASWRVCRLLFHRGTIDLVFPFSHATQYLHADRRRFYRCWGRHNLHRKFIVARGNSSGTRQFLGRYCSEFASQTSQNRRFQPNFANCATWKITEERATESPFLRFWISVPVAVAWAPISPRLSWRPATQLWPRGGTATACPRPWDTRTTCWLSSWTSLAALMPRRRCGPLGLRVRYRLRRVEVRPRGL